MAVTYDYYYTNKSSDSSPPYYISGYHSVPGDHDYWGCLGAAPQGYADLMGSYGVGPSPGDSGDGGGVGIAEVKYDDNSPRSHAYAYRSAYSIDPAGSTYWWAQVDATVYFAVGLMAIDGAHPSSPTATPSTRYGYSTGTGSFGISVGAPNSVVCAIAHNCNGSTGFGITWTGLTEYVEFYPNNNQNNGVASIAVDSGKGPGGVTASASWGASNAYYTAIGHAWIPYPAGGNRVQIMMMKLPDYVENLVSRLRGGGRLKKWDGWYHPERGVFIPQGPPSTCEPLRYTHEGLARKLHPGWSPKNGIIQPRSMELVGGLA